jgi:predicted enzyme related to lactoylglutathione lyase
MSDDNVPCVGGILSADIAVPDHDRELEFYSHVLNTGENPLWRKDLMNNLGTPIIGLGARVPEYDQLPLHWMPHIQVADVAASAKRALELNGRELMHGKDDKGTSQWAVLLDPNGSAFGIIPVVPISAITPPEGDTSKPTGCISWIDLTVSDATATRDFYQQVIGWSIQDVEMKDAQGSYVDYNMLGADGKPAAGICHARGANLGIPPVWILYIPVGDLAESLNRVRDRGGKVIRENKDSNGSLSSAIIQDPVGVYLALG